jgi:hypothetical protein
MSSVPRKPCKMVRLDEFSYWIKLDDGVEDTTIRPVKLSKRARKYLRLLPKSPANKAKKKK